MTPAWCDSASSVSRETCRCVSRETVAVPVGAVVDGQASKCAHSTMGGKISPRDICNRAIRRARTSRPSPLLSRGILHVQCPPRIGFQPRRSS
jgi:hypothetical protein